MTLADIYATFPDLFYTQEWWHGQAFAQVMASPIPEFRPSEVPNIDGPTWTFRAADLAARYVKTADDIMWRRFLWTDDYDDWGNRVYVGGVGAYGIDSFQIHRKLEPVAYWPIPV